MLLPGGTIVREVYGNCPLVPDLFNIVTVIFE